MLEAYDNYHSLEEAVRYFMHKKEECYKSARQKLMLISCMKMIKKDLTTPLKFSYTIFIDNPKASYEALSIKMFNSAKKSSTGFQNISELETLIISTAEPTKLERTSKKINSYTIPNSETPSMLFLLKFEGTLMFTSSGNLYCSLALEKSSEILDMIFSYNEIRSFKFSQPSLGLSSAYLRINQADPIFLSCDEAVFKKIKSMVEIFTLKAISKMVLFRYFLPTIRLTKFLITPNANTNLNNLCTSIRTTFLPKRFFRVLYQIMQNSLKVRHHLFAITPATQQKGRTAWS